MNTILSRINPADSRRIARHNIQWSALESALDELVLDDEYPLDVMQIMSYLQSSLLKRQELFTEIEPMYANIQLISDVIDALHPVMNMNPETDRLTQRAEKLEQLKIDVAKVKVMA